MMKVNMFFKHRYAAVRYSLFFILYSLFIAMASPLHAAAPIPRISVFSTSADWEAVTGLRYSTYDVSFRTDSKLIGGVGLEIYVLDGFPCYGQSDRTEIWFGPNGKSNGNVTMVCLYPPEKIYFAWRNAARNADQDATKGILECPNQSRADISIDLSKCTQGREWKEYK